MVRQSTKVLAADGDMVRLLQWCHRRDKAFKKSKIVPAEFQIGTTDPSDNSSAVSKYRGICTLKQVSAGEEILFMPESCLITSQEFSADLKSADLSLHEKFVVFLLTELDKCAGDRTNSSPWLPYLKTLPEDFSRHHPGYLRRRERELLPEWCGDVLTAQNGLVEEGYRKSQSLLQKTVKKSVSLTEYRWAWYVTYTRTVFFLNRDSQPAKEMALAPFLDLFNHAPEPNTNVSYQDGVGYCITAKWDIPPMEQLFISYGTHSTFKLWSDYGFLPAEENPYDCIPLQPEKLMKNEKFFKMRGDGRKLNVIKQHDLLKELYILDKELSPNLELLISVVLWNPAQEHFNFNVNKNREFMCIAREIIKKEEESLTEALALLNKSTEGSPPTTLLESTMDFLRASVVHCKRIHNVYDFTGG